MLLSMSTWWQELLLFEKINWAIAIPFSVLFLIQIILTFFGGDIDDVEADGDADAAVEGDTGIDFQFITLKNLIAFFTIYGWTGIVCIDSGLGIGASTAISFSAGMVMMTIMSTIVYFMGKLTENGALNINNAIGKTCSVYLTIPASRSGMGKVQIQVQGLQTLNAMTDSETDIKTGGIVEVTNVLNNEILLVKQSSL